MNPNSQASKEDVYRFWNEQSCGEALYLRSADLEGYAEQAKTRYALEPYIVPFAEFDKAAGLKVLEIGVGLGADHQRFAAAGADLYGIDLTERAVEHTRRRLAAYGLTSKLSVGDAEALDFPDQHFDLVYSWGVLHHTPNVHAAVSEVHRVLKPGGRARIMLYHKWSVVGLMLWTRYALLRLRPWRSLKAIYAEHLESPGTQAFSRKEAQALFDRFRDVKIDIVLSHGDLLMSEAGQRHRGPLLAIARKIWPRTLIRTLFPRAGLFMLISATK